MRRDKERGRAHRVTPHFLLWFELDHLFTGETVCVLGREIRDEDVKDKIKKKFTFIESMTFQLDEDRDNRS